MADPLPWLLDPENPSARYLALRHLLGRDERDSQSWEARAAIPNWPPVRDILAQMDPVDFWGRAQRPFYGGAVGTYAILYLLAQLGAPRTPKIEAACEDLLAHGQHALGGFPNDGPGGRMVLCYTGNAIRTLIHFGYRDDPRLALALEALSQAAVGPEGLTCAYADGQECQWGITKALAAYAGLPAPFDDPERRAAIAALANAVLDHAFDLQGRDAGWLAFGFPLNYQSDLTELCATLVRLGYQTDPRMTGLLDLISNARTAAGRWIKRYGTRAFRLDPSGEPSKWITIRALRALRARAA